MFSFCRLTVVAEEVAGVVAAVAGEVVAVVVLLVAAVAVDSVAPNALPVQLVSASVWPCCLARVGLHSNRCTAL